MVVRFLADQLKVPPEGLSAYGRRAQTRTDHFLAVQDHLGYRKAGPEERERLARWLLDRGSTLGAGGSQTLEHGTIIMTAMGSASGLPKPSEF